MRILLFALLVPSVAIQLSTPGCSQSQRCNKCKGSCSRDSDCAVGLKCFVRTLSTELVPGCEPGGSGDVPTTNYCYEPCPVGLKPTAGCTGQLSSVLANAHSSCGITDGSLDIWVNTAVATNELYDMTSADMAITGDLTVSGVITSTNTIAANARTATTAYKLQHKYSIGGVAFDGTHSINLRGVNIAGNQATSGNAATATKLKTKYSIGGVAFDGTHSINLRGVNIAGNQATSGNAATASYATTSGKSNVGVISNGHGSTVFVVTTPNYGGTGGGQPLTCSNGWYGLQYNAARNRLYVGSTGHSSDRRIKKNIRPMPDAVALDILRKLDVKYYNYIDEETMGSQNVIGFIAQEVLDILPSAASVEPGTIPYHRSEVDVRWGETASGYTMTLLSLSLEPGKYGFIMDDKDDLFLETLDGRTFKTEKKYSKVHLAVKEIDDFHRIDKAKIFAVGYAAVQQVDKNQQVLQDKVRTLEETIQELTTRLEALLAAPEV